MVSYVVTGGTGFLGRRVVPRLLNADPTAEIHLLVRRSSLSKLEQLIEQWQASNRVHALLGDLSEPGLGLHEADTELRMDHVIHLGAVYDMASTEADSRPANVEGTRAIIELAKKAGAMLHHISSVAVAGDYEGTFTEDDFDLGQNLPTAYHQTKFEAEQLVRNTPGLKWRVYRPAAVVGDSQTGEMDKLDGPYYFFGNIATLAKLPSQLPIAIPDIGSTNIVPVDFVADALVELIHQDTNSNKVFHLTNPRPQPIRELYQELGKVAGAPRAVASVPRRISRPAFNNLSKGRTKIFRNLILKQMGIPPAVFDNMTFPSTFSSEKTQEALRRSGIIAPELSSYAEKIWSYWAENLDPDRAYRRSKKEGLAGSHVLITGASSGIGRSAALAVAQRGATVFLLARSADELHMVVEEIRAQGGSAFAFPCDITDTESVNHTVKKILGEHRHVDYLVNNAGRSIRRSVSASTDRLHDFERTMAVNYFGAVRLVLALLPHMQERRFGHIVNISSIGVLGRGPQFSAYVASKAALDAFSDVAATETWSQNITFTNIHMPLVKTPMIAPTTAYKNARPASPEKAAAMVVRALVDKPKRIDTPLGTLGEFGRYFNPKFTDSLQHQAYLLFPDSAAAQGIQAAEIHPPKEKNSVQRHPKNTRNRRPNQRVTRQIKRVARMIPGVHW
ncbi:MAG: SDR family oxidoreductase [Mycobacteriaceae bacterium]